MANIDCNTNHNSISKMKSYIFYVGQIILRIIWQLGFFTGKFVW